MDADWFEEGGVSFFLFFLAVHNTLFFKTASPDRLVTVSTMWPRLRKMFETHVISSRDHRSYAYAVALHPGAAHSPVGAVAVRPASA